MTSQLRVVGANLRHRSVMLDSVESDLDTALERRDLFFGCVFGKRLSLTVEATTTHSHRGVFPFRRNPFRRILEKYI